MVTKQLFDKVDVLMLVRQHISHIFHIFFAHTSSLTDPHILEKNLPYKLAWLTE